MPDQFKSVRPGDPLTIHAPVWNAMLEAAVAEKRRATGLTFGTLTSRGLTDLVWLKNETGDDLHRFDVVGFDVPMFPPVDSTPEGEAPFLAEAAFRAVVPLTRHAQRFAVMLDPAPADEMGRGYVSGVFPVNVDVRDVEDAHAIAKDSETGHLISCSGGGCCQILWAELQEELDPTGVQWCLVRVGQSLETSFLAQLTSSLSARSGTTVHSADATVLLLSSGAIADDPDRATITVWNLLNKTIASGAYVVVVWGSGAWWVVAVGDCGNVS